jgi:hypothetical protein
VRSDLKAWARRRLIVAVIAMIVAAGTCNAHVGSIDLFVNAENQLFPLETFALPQFVEFLGIEISTDGPGFGVNFPANGVLVGNEFSVDVAFDLLYWDGAGIGQTSASISMEAPTFDNQGWLIESPISEYVITANSGYQTSMLWGTYNGAQFWEAHGLNFLTPLDTEPGIYGVVLKVHGTLHESTDPFVIPFVFDPDNAWDSTQETVGATRLRDATTALAIADLNVDGHVDTTDVDALVVAIASQSHGAAFDLTDDGLVDEDDLTEWLLRAGHVRLPELESFLPGDANLDGLVDGLDFAAWNAAKFTLNPAWSQGDFNADGVVDGLDLFVWNANKFGSPGAVPPSVPEPTAHTALLLIAALASVGFTRTR